MNKYFVILIIILASSFSGFAQDKQAGGSSVDNTPIPFTLGDRDRLVRLEANQRAYEYRFDAIDKRLDSLQTLIYFALGAIFSMFGFILWDRRSYMKPIKAEQENQKEKIKLIEQILKESSTDISKLFEVLKTHGFL